MTVKAALTAALRGRRRDVPATVDAMDAHVDIDPSSVQIFAHGVIAELFGAGLRIQNLRAQVAEELHPELEEVVDQIDKAIRELREFAFTGKVPGIGEDETTSAGP